MGTGLVSPGVVSIQGTLVFVIQLSSHLSSHNIITEVTTEIISTYDQPPINDRFHHEETYLREITV